MSSPPVEGKIEDAKWNDGSYGNFKNPFPFSILRFSFLDFHVARGTWHVAWKDPARRGAVEAAGYSNVVNGYNGSQDILWRLV